jgi:uncharacterized protein YigA (DUF484 family)
VAGLSEEVAVVPTLDEAQVVAWLREHPDLIDRYPDLLETLELSHKSGAAVSLIERQVELLRAKSRRLEDRIASLIDFARDNERRATNMHKLARTLIRSPSLAAVAAGLRVCMREDFDIDDIFIGINGTAFLRHDIEGIVPIEPESAIARAYGNFFRTRLIECGPIDEARARLLFPRCDAIIRSAAVVPLEKEKNLGMIALGSRDAERFQPRQGKMFLEMTAELMAAAVRARLT